MAEQRYTPAERLKMYKEALKEYQKPGHDEYRWNGFCMFFGNYFNIENIYELIYYIFPEIIQAAQQEPQYAPDADDLGYWFKCGSKAPRIRTLKRAIKLLETDKS
jgi:hypothetical protein